MKRDRKWLSRRAYRKGILISAVMIFIFMGCATSAEFDPKATGPQMVVDPDTIRLGVAKVAKAQILFKGRGFVPEDSVFIQLLGVKKDGKTVDVPLADANVNKDGSFSAKVGTIAKVSEILRKYIYRFA